MHRLNDGYDLPQQRPESRAHTSRPLSVRGTNEQDKLLRTNLMLELDFCYIGQIVTYELDSLVRD